MARRNISLPDDLDDLVRREGLNVSALARRAIVGELHRRSRMARLDEWLDELDAAHGPPSAEVVAAAEEWAKSALPVRRGNPAAKAPAQAVDSINRSRRVRHKSAKAASASKPDTKAQRSRNEPASRSRTEAKPRDADR